MTPPAGVANTLDLPVDPQLVHDLAETFIAGVGDKRAKILRFVPAIRFHSVENDAGVFAQRMHGEVSVITATLGITYASSGRPALSPCYDYVIGVSVGGFMRAAVVFVYCRRLVHPPVE
jgi:hypothetical protein